MKTINEFLSDLRRLDVKLWADGDDLCYRANKETLTPTLRQELKQRKAEILAFLHQANTSTNANLPPILPASRDKDLPLSFAQTRLWFLDQLEPGSSTYNMPAAYRLTGSLNIAALEQSLSEIVQRHEVLRTTFPSVDGQPSQAIASSTALTLPITDLREYPETEKKAHAQQIATDEAQQPFNLATGPLFRAKLLRLEQEEQVLLLTLHHIIGDGWSFDVLFHELSSLYKAFSTGKPSPLPELPIQYADFALWQRNWLPGEVLNSQLNYWRQQLKGSLPALQLPTDYPRPPVQSYRGAYQSLVLPNSLTEELKALSQQQGVTLFMTLLATFQTLLSRYSGQEDIIIGTPIAGRNQVATERLIGFFVNTLILRANLEGNPSFRELLGRVREVALGAYDHQDLPFEKLVEELQPERDLSRSPLFQVMFVLQNTSMSALELPGLTINSLNINSATAKFDLTLFVKETALGLVASFEYNTDLFNAATINRMLGHFHTLLEGIVANPDQRLWDLPLLTPTEEHQLLVEWNKTQIDYPNNTCIHQLFEFQVEQTPDAIAAIFENQQLTYLELNAKANQLAHYLQKLGVEPEVLVGICVKRSLDLLVAVLGILKAGGAYVPLDPAYPQERLNFMLEDAQIPILLTQQPLLNKFPKHKAHVVCLDRDREEIDRENEQNPTSSVTANNLAYVIYTSGSTGQPKGVQVLHRAVVNLLNSMGEQPGLTNQDILLSVTSLSFDIAALELFLPIIVGARVVLVSREIASDGLKLSACLVNSGATVMQATPATWQLLLEAGWGGSNRLKILCGGEALPRTLANQLLKRGASLWNLYGPTETTIWSAVCKIESEDGSVSIGKPIANTQIYLLDSHCQPVPIGVFGELHIGGVGLARGYLNLPNLTAEKFIPNPFSNKAGDRLYKTGDLARYLPDGNIEFLGRLDHQVKIRGFRIELGEIEAVLAQYPAVQQAVVTTKENVPNDKRLVAYAVPNPNQPPTTDELRRFLAEKLPNYMVPSAFVLLESLPLTPNGKVDRRALPIPEQQSPHLEKVYIAPRNQLEFQLTLIWENILGIKYIGVRDNFFELGGHSLLAVRLFAQIEKILGKNLPLATLFKAPTIEQLASLLSQQSSSIPLLKEMIPAQGSELSFFWCVQGFTEVDQLAKYLDTNQPLFGLQSGFFEISNPATHIRDWATRCVEEIRGVQPDGPYFVGGFCFGGLVAFEIAQQLQAQGQKVALLAIVERDGLDPIYRTYQSIVSRFSWHSRNILQLKPVARLTYIVNMVKRVTMRAFSRLVRRNPDEKLAPTYDKGFDVAFQQSLEAAQAYALQQAYSGRVVLFIGTASKRPFFLFPRCGWGKLVTGELELCLVPGDHTSLLKEPHIQVLAEKLRFYLNQPQAQELKTGSHQTLPIANQASLNEKKAFVIPREQSDTWSTLVAIRPSGSKPPLFCIPAAGSSGFGHVHLARYLDPDQPVYGIQALGFDGKQPPQTRIEEMATHYIQEIRTLQPNGPYFLVGHCFGGVVAFEIAQQLHQQGQKVALLALLDVSAPNRSPQQRLSERPKRRSLRERLAQNRDSFLRLGFTYVVEKVGWWRKNIRRHFDKISCKFYQYVGRPLPHALRYVPMLEAASQALKNYIPQIYPGRVSLFMASTWFLGEQLQRDPQFGWGELATGGLEIHQIPGNHHSIIAEPDVQVLAEKLKACIDRVHADDLAHIPPQHSDLFVCDRENPEGYTFRQN